MSASRLAFLSLVSLALPSCAALWGFDDGSLASDAQAVGPLASPTRIDAGAYGRDAAHRTPDSGQSTTVSQGPLVPAESGVAESGPRAPSGRDAGVERADTGPAAEVGPPRDATRDHEAPEAGGPACNPRCNAPFECKVAVGGSPVCVTGGCHDSKDCASGCCVWLDPASPEGLCEAMMGGGGAGVQCLCVSGGGGGKGDKGGTCSDSCGPPPNATAPGIEVCNAPPGPGNVGGGDMGQ